MVLDAVSNFVRGETDAAIDSTQTSVSVVDASIFPDPSADGEYNVVIWDASQFPRPDQDADVEILRVTAIDTGTDTLTVTRGQETTAGASHPSGSAVHLSPTAKMFGDIESTFADFWDDGAQELTADVNNQSVSTEGLSISGLQDGAQVQYLTATDANDDGAEQITEKHDGVSTTATRIWESHVTNTANAFSTDLVMVWGDERGSENRFGDIVHFVDGTNVISSGSTSSPAGRTYSRANGKELHLAMASGTYDVVVTGISLFRNYNSTT